MVALRLITVRGNHVLIRLDGGVFTVFSAVGWRAIILNPLMLPAGNEDKWVRIGFSRVSALP